MEFSSSPLFWQTTLLEMAAGSLFQQGEISGFYTHLIVVQAEVSTAVSIICWDLDPCQWEKEIFFFVTTALKSLSDFFLLPKQRLPFFEYIKLRISPSLSPQDARASITSKAYSQLKYKQKLKSISIYCQMGILRRLMTNKIPRFILYHCNQCFLLADLHLVSVACQISYVLLN